MWNLRLTTALFALAQCLMLTNVRPSGITLLTAENWDELTYQKTVFVNFRSEHCAHCRELAPAWEKLESSFENHDHGLVAQVNCDIESALCKKLDVIGTPTIFYGDPTVGGIFLEEFGGDRDLENLHIFATEKLVPICTIQNVAPCDREIARSIRDWTHMSLEMLSNLVIEKEDAIKNAETTFKNEEKKMTELYENMNNALESEKARIRSQIKLLKDISVSKKS